MHKTGKAMLDFGFYNMDCMEGMKQFPNKYFELAIVDPPYGSARYKIERTGGSWFKNMAKNRVFNFEGGLNNKTYFNIQ
jgi:DNA modification methylase